MDPLPKLSSPPRDPPDIPDGWHTGPPDFVGVGVQRCGTTRWYRLLLDHPQIEGSTHKELHYLSRAWGEPLQSAAYARYFPRPAGSICGEWSGGYLYDPWVPGALAALCPDAKVLVSLRDPVERFKSAAWRAHRKQKAGALDNATVQLSHDFLRGLYAGMVQRLLAQFKGSVMILQFEKCVADPAGEIRRTYDFLGVDPDHAPSNLDARPNYGRVPGELPRELHRQLVVGYRRDVRTLEKIVPGFDVSLWPNFRTLAS